MMEAMLWILLPGCAALASGLLAWFVMQSRMEVALAEQRTELAEQRGTIDAEKAAIHASMQATLHATEESVRRKAFEAFLSELKVEQRHYTRENRLLMQNRRSLALQERMYFRNIPLSDWIEHEVQLDEGVDIDRMVQDMTIFDKSVVNISEIPRRRALA